MKTLTNLIVTTGLAIIVSGCAVQTVDTFCLNYTPITYTKAHDSEETKAQIKEQNAVWLRLCK